MHEHPSGGWFLLATGLVLAGIGLVWILLPHVPWLGRLPGDINIDRGQWRFYFPLTTCLLLSALLSVLMWLMRRWIA